MKQKTAESKKKEENAWSSNSKASSSPGIHVQEVPEERYRGKLEQVAYYGRRLSEAVDVLNHPNQPEHNQNAAVDDHQQVQKEPAKKLKSFCLEYMFTIQASKS